VYFVQFPEDIYITVGEKNEHFQSIILVWWQNIKHFHTKV